MPTIDPSTSKTRLFVVLLPFLHFCACVLIAVSIKDSNRGWWYMFYGDFPSGIVSWLLAGATNSLLFSFGTVGTLWWLLLGKKADSMIDRQKATIRWRHRILPLITSSEGRIVWRFLLPLLHVCVVAALTLLASDTPILDGAWKYLIFADLPISVVLVAPLMVMEVPAPLVLGVWGTLWWYLLGRLADTVISRRGTSGDS